MQRNSVNKVILVGNLGQDPEARFTPQGTAVTNLSVATNESWKDQSGEIKEKTEWHRVVMYGWFILKAVSKPGNGKTRIRSSGVPRKFVVIVSPCLVSGVKLIREPIVMIKGKNPKRMTIFRSKLV